MNKGFYIFFCTIICLFSCNSGNKSDHNKAVKTKKETSKHAFAYNETMNTIHSQVDLSFNQIIDAIDDFNYQDADMARQVALLKIEQARQSINNMEDFDGNDEFKNEMLLLLIAYEEIINQDLDKIIKLLSTNEEFTIEHLKEYNGYYGDALDNYDDAVYKFIEYQKIFANKWNFQLEEVVI